MLDWLEYLRQLNIWSMMLRVLCAMAAGGLVGFEREKKGRPAGFRTYMLVALGAALTIMLSQYLNLMFEGPWKEIGDSLGIKTCWFNPKNEENRSGLKPDYEIRRLQQIPELIERIFC